MSTPFIAGGVAPSVHARINAGQIARPAPPESPSTVFAVGYSPWGPVNMPTVVTSWSEYVRKFGSFNANSFLDDFCYIYFNLYPGTRAVICRVTGALPVVATATVNDQGDTPHATLRFDGKYPSSTVDITVKIEAGAKQDTFKLTITSAALGGQPEVWNDLKVDAASSAYVNQNSNLVKITNLGSANPAPDNLPALTAALVLTGGDDKFSDLSDADYIGTDDGVTRTGLQTFNSEDFGPGQVAIPGLTTADVYAALIAHAEAFKRLALLDEALGADKDDVVLTRNLYDSAYAAIHWPRPQHLDFAGSGIKKFYPTSGFVAGECAKADLLVGPHRAPANLGAIPGALDVERSSSGFPQTDSEATRAFLNDRQVNVITPLFQQSIKVYGERVMSTGLVQMIHELRVLCLLYYQLKKDYQQLPFSVVDSSGAFFRQVKSITESRLREYKRAGALTGDKESDAFLVKCDRTNNPPESLDAQRVNVLVGIHISGTAEIIQLDLQYVPQTQDLSILQA
jgi:phage tail sheath protein FI